MKKTRFLSAVMAAMLCFSLAPAASAGSPINITNPNNTSGYRDPYGYWKNGLYYPGGYWQDNIYYGTDISVGYWKDGVFYSYGMGNNSITLNPPSSTNVNVGPGYWQNGIYYPYYYNNEGYWKNGTYYPNGDANGYWVNGVFYPYAYYPGNTYPYGYYPYNFYTPGYYNPTTNATLGGVKVPSILLTQAVANNKNIGFTMRGTTVAYAHSDLAPVSGQTAVTLDFTETVGRAHDQSLVVTLAAVGSNVSADDQKAVMLNAYPKHFEAAKEQGVESIAFSDKGRNIIVTVRNNDIFISKLKDAYVANGADVEKDRFVIQATPVTGDYQDDVSAALARVKLNSPVYSVQGFIVKNGKKIDISSSLGTVNLRVKADTADRSLLSYYDGNKFELAPKGTFVLDEGTNQASGFGDVPMGSTVAIVRVKSK